MSPSLVPPTFPLQLGLLVSLWALCPEPREPMAWWPHPSPLSGSEISPPLFIHITVTCLSLSMNIFVGQPSDVQGAVPSFLPMDAEMVRSGPVSRVHSLSKYTSRALGHPHTHTELRRHSEQGVAGGVRACWAEPLRGAAPRAGLSLGFADLHLPFNPHHSPVMLAAQVSSYPFYG